MIQVGMRVMFDGEFWYKFVSSVYGIHQPSLRRPNPLLSLMQVLWSLVLL